MMNILRRRNAAHASSVPSGTDSPDDAQDQTYRVVPVQKLHKLTKPRGSKRRTAWIFGLGGIFGIVVAAFFAGHNEMLDLAAFQDLNLDSIMDVLPAGLISDAKDFQVS
jgi:phospholipid:diacylglycerol acyltransferase